MKKRQRFQCYIGGFLCFAILLTGCAKKEEAVDEPSEVPVLETEAETIQQEEVQDVLEEIPEPVEEELPTADITETIKEAYGDDEVTLLTKEVNDISVRIPENEHAQESINAFFQERNEAWETTVGLYTEVIEDSYLAWEESDDDEDWETQEIGRLYELKRLDDQMLCVVENTFVKKGSDQESHVRVSYNFDTWTGKRLSLEEAASHLDEIRTESLAYIGEMLQNEKYEGVLKNNYTEYLEDMLTDATWYTDEKGMYVICNEDIIAPVKAGIIEFFLPYDEVDVIDEVYQPQT